MASASSEQKRELTMSTTPGLVTPGDLDEFVVISQEQQKVGWLHRMGTGGLLWKKDFFVLDANLLKVYANDNCTELKGYFA